MVKQHTQTPKTTERSHPFTHKYRQRMAQLEQDRRDWESHWKEIQDYIFPRRGRYLLNDSENPNDNTKVNSNIINGTPTNANDTLAAGMLGGMTSPTRPWFRLKLAGRREESIESGPAKEWLKEVQTIMLEIFAKSNFYSAVHSMYEELGAFGTGAFLIEEDFNSVIRVTPYTIGEYYLGLDRLNRPSSIYRRFTMTAIQMKAEFGEDVLSEGVRTALTSEQGDQTFTIIHVIQPRDQDRVGRVKNEKLSYESVYFEEGSGERDAPDGVLRESGYRGAPFVAPRWDVRSGDTYGRSPGMEALGDCKMLQKMEKNKLMALDKLVNPPMVGSSDLKSRGGGSVIAGGITYVDSTGGGGAGFGPAYQIRPDMQNIAFEIDRVERRIQRFFRNDLFLSIINETKAMTAREVVERTAEKLVMLGPVLERLQAEMLDVVIDRTFDIAMSLGAIPPAPPEIQGQEVRPEYVSILAQAQKFQDLTPIEQTLGFIGSVAGADPNALDKFDTDQAIDEYADITGIAPTIIRTDEEVAEIRAVRAQQQAQQQQMAMAAEAADTAKVLSETGTDPNKPNALNALLQGIGGGPA